VTVANGLAPDDSGNVAQHHLYTKVVAGERSSFVWIPVFSAYQLIVPGNCGPEHAGRQVGTWVADPPSQGIQEVDWARESFGGFYAGQFEASHADAAPATPEGVGATAGQSQILKVARQCVPWTQVTWAQAIAACEAYDPHAHLMADDEWTALAVWATIHRIPLGGNDHNLKASDRGDLSFIQDPTTNNPRALTGTGRGLPGTGIGFEATTHTGFTVGVADCIGNVLEWTSTVGRTATGSRWMVDEAIDGTCPPSGHVLTLETSPGLRRFGLPGSTGGDAAAAFGIGSDFLASMGTGRCQTMRGGYWQNGKQAGWWFVFLMEKETANINVGFRPVLRYP
jgi:formylglycine-generating enzyme required for sulfatase activity